jgi:segregation and condensation protein B
MSLKAKIEAVIYASEEPVTLAQLAGLFQSEIVEVREARLSAEAAAVESAASIPEPELPAALEGAGQAEEVADVPAAEAVPQADGDPDGASSAEPTASIDASTAADDEKRAARQREREIREELRGILDGLIAEYAEGDRGMEIREIAGGYRVATKPEYHDAVRGFVKSLKPPMKLSLQALETLAVIAYKQPVTAPEVSEIRGVDSGGVLGSLVSRKLITTAGRKQVIGRPILYKTTKEFLLRFGLKDLNELPSIEEFEKMAGELAETDEAVDAGQEMAHAELPFQPNLDEVDEASTAAESAEEPADDEATAAAIQAVNVSGKGGADGGADLPGVRVEPEVKAADLVAAATPAGEPGGGD